MSRRNHKEKKVKARLTFDVKVIVREGVSLGDLLNKETEFLAEPKSVNGCVIDMKLTKVEKL